MAFDFQKFGGRGIKKNENETTTKEKIKKDENRIRDSHPHLLTEYNHDRQVCNYALVM